MPARTGGTSAADAIINLRAALVAGAVLVVAGVALMVWQWPSEGGTVVDQFSAGSRLKLEFDDEGSLAATLVGLALAWLGQALITLGVVGYGALLGIRAAQR